jgi:lactobin A/cerein 7B family class IIb bacteriocin
MANITISDLHPVGIDLSLDSESLFSELTVEELSATHGGLLPLVLLAAALLISHAAY